MIRKFNTKLLFTEADSYVINFMKKIHTKNVQEQRTI